MVKAKLLKPQLPSGLKDKPTGNLAETCTLGVGNVGRSIPKRLPNRDTFLKEMLKVTNEAPKLAYRLYRMKHGIT
jgi:hypothetical protein